MAKILRLHSSEKGEAGKIQSWFSGTTAMASLPADGGQNPVRISRSHAPCLDAQGKQHLEAQGSKSQEANVNARGESTLQPTRASPSPGARDWKNPPELDELVRKLEVWEYRCLYFCTRIQTLRQNAECRKKALRGSKLTHWEFFKREWFGLLLNPGATGKPSRTK